MLEKLKRDIKLSWCEKHEYWWVTNCPDCMADDVERDTRTKMIAEGYRRVPSEEAFWAFLREQVHVFLEIDKPSHGTQGLSRKVRQWLMEQE